MLTSYGSYGCIAFDPGLTTGMAIYRGFTNGERIIIGQFPHFRWVDYKIGQLARDYDTVEVIAEKPFLTPRVNPIVFEVYGAIRERAYDYGLPFINQPPSTPDFISRRYADTLNAITCKEHERDALCHLVRYLTHKKEIPFRSLIPLLENIERLEYIPLRDYVNDNG